MSVLSATNCKPRKEVLKGDLEDAIFAADFGDLIAGKAPNVYSDPHQFFQNTFPTKGLTKIVDLVFERLKNPREAGAGIRLSTGFGGGKTHALITLWHLGKNVGDPSVGQDLLPTKQRPKLLTVVGIDAAKGSVPDFSKHGNTKIHSLWGELFWQLGGEKAFKTLGKADHPEASPNDAQIEAAFPKGPVLILLDELVTYMARLTGNGQGNLLGVLNSLNSVVTKRPQTVLIVTDPTGMAAFAKESAAIASAIRLDEILSRRMSDCDPIGDESAKIIVRRLFENVNQQAAQSTAVVYQNLYKRVHQDSPGSVPASAITTEYARRIADSYPFHPRLLDTAQDRLGALQDFQKSRGVLRLFARILRDVWEAKEDLDLITAGEINWSSPRIQADLLQRLNRQEFKAAVTADVQRHAGELDGGKPHGIHRRAATALLLESLPMQPNSGMEPTELTLAILRPDEAGPEPAEALERLYSYCWHTYPMAGGRGYQFRFQPNIVRQIEERVALIPIEDRRSRVMGQVQEYFGGAAFKLEAWPTKASQVRNLAELQLVLCEDEKTAKSVCAHEDDSDPAAPMPRAFVNAIVAVTASADAHARAMERAARLIALEAIEKEHRTGDAGKLVRDQIDRLKPEFEKQFKLQARRAFDRLVFAGGKVHRLDEKSQFSDEEILQKPQGQRSVRRFLEEHDFIFKAGESLDVPLFLKEILPGAVPKPDNPEVYTAKAIHERFLGAESIKKLIGDNSVVRQTILHAVNAGKIAVRLGDGRAYDDKGLVEGPPGQRRHLATPLTTFSLDDSVWITKAGSGAAVEWLKVDAVPKSGRPGGVVLPPPPKPPATAATANSWEDILELSKNRPLVRLVLIAETPTTAASLISLAQPLGAESLSLTVYVSGDLKDSGSINLSINRVKPHHPTKPLAIAQTIFNALDESASYESMLELEFGRDGRTGLRDLLRQMADDAPEGIRPKADFDVPVEMNS